MLTHAFVMVFAASSLAFAGPGDEETRPRSIPILSAAQLTDGLNTDYLNFTRRNQPFPSGPAVNYLLRLPPADAPPALIAATQAWVLAQYPSMEQRPIDELQDGLADPKGAGARRAVLHWLAQSPLSDTDRAQVAVAVLSRESDRDCRNEVFDALHPHLLAGRDFGVLEGLFKIVESDASAVVEAEKFLAVRALVSMAVRLPEAKIADVHRRLKQIAGEQSTNVSEEIVRSLGASITRPMRVELIAEVLNSGRYPALAKIGALTLLQNDIKTTGGLHPSLQTALQVAAGGDQDEVTAGEVRAILRSQNVEIAAAGDDCGEKVSRLRRRPRPPKKP